MQSSVISTVDDLFRMLTYAFREKDNVTEQISKYNVYHKSEEEITLAEAKVDDKKAVILKERNERKNSVMSMISSFTCIIYIFIYIYIYI